MRLFFMMWALLVVACAQPPEAPEPVRSFPVTEPSTETPRPWIGTSTPTAIEGAPENPPSTLVEDGPYAGWRQRCEPPDKARLCETADHCRDVHHPSNKTLKCIKPWWSDGTKICSPGWSNRSERKWRRERLRTLVHAQYFATEEEGWKGGRARQHANKLSDFLWLVYKRETTGRPWKRHRLNGDVRASKQAWEAQAHRYGHETLTKPTTFRGRPSKTVVGARILPTGNPHYAERWRWETGLGPYGQVAPLWVAGWDKQAPPEILCGEVESTETYLRGARRVWRKLRGGIKCNDETYQPEVTWEILHRGVAGGKLCPGKSSAPFRRRADRLGLDPDQKVSLSMLGEPIDRELQNAVAVRLYALMDATLPTPESLGS